MTSDQDPTSLRCPSCQQSAQEQADFCQSCRFPLLPVANKYRLEQLLNEGGCSHVYLARHIRLQRNAERVIKIIKGDLLHRDPGMAERFYREVQMTADLSHQCQHVVRVFDDFGEEPKLGHYYVMEYLQGGTLADLMSGAQEPLSIELAIHIASQLCDAMYWAHQTGILHRDLKPANIMLIAFEGDPHYVKVLDFGIAKSFAEERAQDSQLTQGAIGTPTYMAPEHFTGGDVDFRADIYALGIIFYELLAGRPPFVRKKQFQSAMIEMMDYHLKTPLPPLREFRPEVPVALADAIHKALEKRAEARYDSARDFKTALQAAIQPAPTPVVPPLQSNSSHAGLAIPPASFSRAKPPPPPPSGTFPSTRSGSFTSASGSFHAASGSGAYTAASGSFAATSGAYPASPSGSYPPPPPPRRKTGTYASTPSIPPPPPTGSHGSLAALPAVLDPAHSGKSTSLSELDTHVPLSTKPTGTTPLLAGIHPPMAPIPKTIIPPAKLPPQPFKSTAEFQPAATNQQKISLRLDNRLIEGAQITMDPQAEPLTLDDIEDDLLSADDIQDDHIQDDHSNPTKKPPIDLGSTGILTLDDLATESRFLEEDEDQEFQQLDTGARYIDDDKHSDPNNPQALDHSSTSEYSSTHQPGKPATLTAPPLGSSQPPSLATPFLNTPSDEGAPPETPTDVHATIDGPMTPAPTDTFEPPKSHFTEGFDLDLFSMADDNPFDTAIQANPFLSDPLLMEIAQTPAITSSGIAESKGKTDSFQTDADRSQTLAFYEPDTRTENAKDDVPEDATEHLKETNQAPEHASEDSTTSAYLESAPSDEDSRAPETQALEETSAYLPSAPLSESLEVQTPSQPTQLAASSPKQNLGETAYFHPMLGEDVSTHIVELGAEPDKEQEEPNSPALDSTGEFTFSSVEVSLAPSEAGEDGEESPLDDAAASTPVHDDQVPSPEKIHETPDLTNLLGPDMYHEAISDEGLLSIDLLADAPSKPRPPSPPDDEEDNTLNINSMSIDGEDPFGLLLQEAPSEQATHDQTPPEELHAASTSEYSPSSALYVETTTDNHEAVPPSEHLEPTQHELALVDEHQPPPPQEPEDIILPISAGATAIMVVPPETGDPFESYDAVVKSGPSQQASENNLPILIILMAGGILLLVGAVMMLRQ